MIDIKLATPRVKVAYIPGHAHGEINHPDVEHGTVSSNNGKNVFVKFDKAVSRLGWGYITILLPWRSGVTINKPYLLIAGDYYYPQGNTSDWIGCFSTYEEAIEQVELVVSSASQFDHYNVKRGEKRVGQCDWYKIVDLREWAQ